MVCQLHNRLRQAQDEALHHCSQIGLILSLSKDEAVFTVAQFSPKPFRETHVL